MNMNFWCYKSFHLSLVIELFSLSWEVSLARNWLTLGVTTCPPVFLDLKADEAKLNAATT